MKRLLFKRTVPHPWLRGRESQSRFPDTDTGTTTRCVPGVGTGGAGQDSSRQEKRVSDASGTHGNTEPVGAHDVPADRSRSGR